MTHMHIFRYKSRDRLNTLINYKSQQTEKDYAFGTNDLLHLYSAFMSGYYRAFSRRFYPKRLPISTFVRRKRNKNISLSVAYSKDVEGTSEVLLSPVSLSPQKRVLSGHLLKDLGKCFGKVGITRTVSWPFLSIAYTLLK